MPTPSGETPMGRLADGAIAGLASAAAMQGPKALIPRAAAR
ncbi:hypothetical protein EP7_002917 [Isosphaeraceae bacterium EP7]